MKQCSKCKQDKELDQFWKNKRYSDGINRRCILCASEEQKKSYFRVSGKRNEYIINRRRKIKDEFNKYLDTLNLKCERCGENHKACLDFHHVDPKQKNYTIGNLKWAGASNKKLLDEIKKCIVLCANCHRKLHWGENNIDE